MIVTASTPQAHCPECQQLSSHVHSRYQRSVTDLPRGEITVRLELQTRKFFCDNDGCRQRIFCERLPEVVAPYGRQTIRFNTTAGVDNAYAATLISAAMNRILLEHYFTPAPNAYTPRKIISTPAGRRAN